MEGDVASRRRRAKPVQLVLFRRGGRRPGAGRKPKGDIALAPRDRRPALAARYPVLVTARLVDGLPSLRRLDALRVLHGVFEAASSGPAFRVVHASIQANHVHWIVEASGREALSNGMRGLLVAMARRLNRPWGRRGAVVRDRFHAQVLRTPREVRNALVYVLHNARKHGHAMVEADPCSSGPWFDEWAEPLSPRRRAGGAAPASPFARPRTWLLAVGWRRHGLIGLGERPGRAAGAAREGAQLRGIQRATRLARGRRGNGQAVPRARTFTVSPIAERIRRASSKSGWRMRTQALAM
jgi:REP element-mobilizing transposase RayT